MCCRAKSGVFFSIAIFIIFCTKSRSIFFSFLHNLYYISLIIPAPQNISFTQEWKQHTWHPIKKYQYLRYNRISGTSFALLCIQFPIINSILESVTQKKKALQVIGKESTLLPLISEVFNWYYKIRFVYPEKFKCSW